MATITVGSGGDHASIQAALSAGAVSNGDTIQLVSGYSVDERIQPSGLDSITVIGDVENPGNYDVYYSNPGTSYGYKTIDMNNCTNWTFKGFKGRYTGDFSTSSGFLHGGYGDNGGHLLEDMIIETSGYYGVSGMGDNTTYRRCKFDGSSHTAADNAYLLGPDSSNASGSLVESCFVLNASYICIYLGTNGNPGPTIKNTTVYNNRTAGNASSIGIYVLGDNAKVYNTTVGMDCLTSDGFTGDKALLYGSPTTSTASHCVLWGARWSSDNINTNVGSTSNITKGSGVSSNAVVFNSVASADYTPFSGSGALLFEKGSSTFAPTLGLARNSFRTPPSIGAYAYYVAPASDPKRKTNGSKIKRTTGVKDVAKELESSNKFLDEFFVNPSNFETIDYAFYDFINDKMQIRANTNKGWKKVTLVWSSPERVYFSKKDKDIYDIDGTLIYPIISIQRTSMTKDLAKKGKYFGAPTQFTDPIRGGRIAISQKIVSDKTNNFAIAQNIRKFNNVNRTPGRQPYYPLVEKKNKKVVIETLSVPQPVYVSMGYQVTLQSNYQQHMNQMLQPFVTLGGHINSFLIEKDGHKYETFLQSDLSQNNNISSFDQEERVFQTTVNFEVLGYVIGEGKNQERPKVTRRENVVDVKLPRERVILSDEQDFDPKSGFYRD